MNKKKIVKTALLFAFMVAGHLACLGQKVQFLSESHCMIKFKASTRYLLMPVEEKADICNVKVLSDNQQVKAMNIRLAVDHVDYYVPVSLSELKGKMALIDIHVNGDIRKDGSVKDYACWKEMKFSDTFDTVNRERFRPLYHHTPPYGWMNDPNGMFYKDGVYHLYYQWNPYGSQWENMHWGHSTSRDLLNWNDEGLAIAPDALGTIFSGSCVVDKNNTAGFGEGAVVAFYTSAGENQTQSMAYSTDNGKTFTKYTGNPVLAADVPDFRDPKVFWNPEAGKWNLILAAGQEMRIYSSANLKEWAYESSFGQGYGNHGGVWECPDLIKLQVRGTDKQKWLLICNINPGGPFGGSATQYFVGRYDGHRFTCESKPETTKWMDYGKDHYATVTFDNAPDGRHVALAWMSNWQYANQVPTKQYRSANSVPRDLDLFEYEGETYVGVTPSKELLALRGKETKHPTDACEIAVDVKGSLQLTLSNGKGEQVVMVYDDAKHTFTMDRAKSGDAAFSEAFPAATEAPVHGGTKQLRIFVDRCSIEAFDADGKMSMSNLVFPSEPYNKLTVKGKAKVVIYTIK
jgi:levanase/fructan beta-fructosidase